MYPRVPNAQEVCVYVGVGAVGAKGVCGWGKASTVRNDSQRNYSDFILIFVILSRPFYS